MKSRIVFMTLCPMPNTGMLEEISMDHPGSNSEKIAPSPRGFGAVTLFALLVVVAQVVVSLATYPFLPDIVPSHWDAAGHVNGYMPKWGNALLFPAMSLGIYVLVRVLMRAGPRLGYQNSRSTPEVVNLIMAGVLLFMLIIQLTTTATSFGVAIDITLVTTLCVSVLLLFIGNYLGKLQRNFWAGIRTPWTLASDVVWERTHRLGGWLFVLVGFIGIVTSFVPQLRLWGMLLPLTVVIVVLFVYSYVAYRHYEVGGRDPLSPPFDGGEG